MMMMMMRRRRRDENRVAGPLGMNEGRCGRGGVGEDG